MHQLEKEKVLFLSSNSVINPQLCLNELNKSSTLSEAVLKISQVYNFRYHPYLIWMQLDSTSKSDFLQTQLPFRFAVESFPQALAAVLARISVLEERLSLFENVAEEHGWGNTLKSHKYSFREYLQALGATLEDLKTPSTPPVLAFNASIINHCLTQSSVAGAAALGIIEHLYVEISAAIAHTVHHRGWAAPGSQSHYAVHEELDVEHARDLLDIAELGWSNPATRSSVIQGLVLGAYYFWTLYHDLQLKPR